MKKVTAASGDYLVYFHPSQFVSNIFMRNCTYPLMFIGRVYNTNSSICIHFNGFKYCYQTLIVLFAYTLMVSSIAIKH